MVIVSMLLLFIIVLFLTVASGSATYLDKIRKQNKAKK